MSLFKKNVFLSSPCVDKLEEGGNIRACAQLSQNPKGKKQLNDGMSTIVDTTQCEHTTDGGFVIRYRDEPSVWSCVSEPSYRDFIAEKSEKFLQYFGPSGNICDYIPYDCVPSKCEEPVIEQSISPIFSPPIAQPPLPLLTESIVMITLPSKG